MICNAPEWFLLVPVLILAAWVWKALRLWEPLRALALLTTVVALADPQIRLRHPGMDLWVLFDRSESAQDLTAAGEQEWRRLLEKSRQSHRDDTIYVDFASETIRQSDNEGGGYRGGRGLTKTGLALESVLALSDANRPARIMMFTDGYGTEPLGRIGEKLAERGIPFYYRILEEEGISDYRISRLDLPARAQLGEPFVVYVAVSGQPDGNVPLRILRNGDDLVATTVAIENGRGVARFSDRIERGGAYRYEAVISPETDTHSGNNSFESWIEVSGGPRVLLVTSYSDDPLAAALDSQGYEVEVSSAGPADAGRLAGCKLVIINNVPAHEFGAEFLENLDFYVREQGGGLLMVGGKRSFGSGGYFQSPVDPLLPVSMELKMEHRKLAVAMAVVLDRSGSMSMTVGGAGGRAVSKMDLANEGTAKAVELLGFEDLITVYAVDSSPHKMVPLMKVGENRSKISRLIRRIESMGGGIFVYTGLKAGWEALKKAPVGQRHIILFSDAADSEEPGDYKKLVKEIVDEGAVISVIGLGTPGDTDADFLRDIAKRGNGRIFFTQDARKLPNIFAQETVTVARSAFIEDPVRTKATGQWFELAARDLEWLPEVDGYNLSYLRPENASQALITGDEYAAPLVAWVPRGSGRTAAVSFPLGGDHSQRTRNWNRYGDFTQTLCRWLMGETLPPGIGLRAELRGTQLGIDLFYEGADWDRVLAERAPLAVLSEGREGGPTRNLTWQRMAPGHFQVTADLPEGEMIRGAVKAGDFALPFGPLVVGSSTEWAFDRERREELEAAAFQSGGGPVLELESIWDRLPQRDSRGIRNWLFVSLMGLLLGDALLTRLGIRWRPWAWRPGLRGAAAAPADQARKAPDGVGKGKKRARPRRRVRKKAAPAGESSSEAVNPEGVKNDPSEEAETRRSRFDRARRRR